MVQLAQMSGKTVSFYTAVTIIDGPEGTAHQLLDTTTAVLRSLSTDEIERYVQADQPLDCAGSFKMEQLGISLFESINTEDPTALVGLPLIGVSKILRQCGIALP